MAFVLVGVLMLLLHFVGIGPTAQWDPGSLMGFIKFSVPFLLALAWWAWSDASGRTKRLEMERDTARKAARRQRNISAMGLGPDAPRSGSYRRR